MEVTYKMLENKELSSRELLDKYFTEIQKKEIKDELLKINKITSELLRNLECE
jgi:hypothetical protein